MYGRRRQATTVVENGQEKQVLGCVLSGARVSGEENFGGKKICPVSSEEDPPLNYVFQWQNFFLERACYLLWLCAWAHERSVLCEPRYIYRSASYVTCFSTWTVAVHLVTGL